MPQIGGIAGSASRSIFSSLAIGDRYAIFQLSLVSPEKPLFAGPVDQVDLPGVEGDFGVAVLLGLRPHQPAIGAVAADQLGMAAGLDDPAMTKPRQTNYRSSTPFLDWRDHDDRVVGLQAHRSDS